MKRLALPVVTLVCVTLACSLGGLAGEEGRTATSPPSPLPATLTPRSEKRCGDGVCDGPENESLCPQDCAPLPPSAEPASTPPSGATAEARPTTLGILFQLAEHTIISTDAGGASCQSLTFLRFLDAGYVHADGSGAVLLTLKDHPTSKVTARTNQQYFYLSTPNNPLVETYGVQMFNWDVDGQRLWEAAFAGGEPAQIAPPGERFPGDVAASPGNVYLVYPLTRRPATAEEGPVGLFPKFDPFRSDSSLAILRRADRQKATALDDRFNRQLFSSFADFSADGATFFTLSRAGERFGFVAISLDDGTVTDFATRFPQFDWASLDWSAFFPRTGDAAYAAFAISPDETRLVAYKNIYSVDMEHICAPAATHHLWVFDLEQGRLEQHRDQPGTVSDASWRADSSAFALAVNSHGGCYPAYIDAHIELHDRDGGLVATLVTEAQSKITTLGWAPEGTAVAYDVYGMDLVGRIKTVDTATGEVIEVVNAPELAYPLRGQTNPVTLLLADWVVESSAEGP